MPVLANCSSCGSKLNVPDNLLGREVMCPRCGTVTVVTDSAAPARSGSAPSEAGPMPGRSQPAVRRAVDFDEDDGRRRPRRQPRDEYDEDRDPRRANGDAAAQGNGAALGLGIASLVLGILAIPFALVPCIGLYSIPVSGLGLVLGLIGFVIVMVSKKGSTGFPIAGSVVSFIALAVAGLWFLVCAGMMTGMQKGVEKIAATIDEQQRQEAATWVDASKDAATHGDVRVRVKSVTLGPVDLDDGDGAIQKSADKNLVIHLVIENTSATSDIDYKGWSAKPGFDPDAATLKDKWFSNYPAAAFAQKVKGQVRNRQRIKTGESLEDVLVFTAPLNNPEELRLELPASAVGGVGPIKLRIPASMIKR